MSSKYQVLFSHFSMSAQKINKLAEIFLKSAQVIPVGESREVRTVVDPIADRENRINDFVANFGPTVGIALKDALAAVDFDGLYSDKEHDNIEQLADIIYKGKVPSMELIDKALKEYDAGLYQIRGLFELKKDLDKLR